MVSSSGNVRERKGALPIGEERDWRRREERERDTKKGGKGRKRNSLILLRKGGRKSIGL